MPVVYPLQNHSSHVKWNQYLISSFKLCSLKFFFSPWRCLRQIQMYTREESYADIRGTAEGGCSIFTLKQMCRGEDNKVHLHCILNHVKNKYHYLHVNVTVCWAVVVMHSSDWLSCFRMMRPFMSLCWLMFKSFVGCYLNSFTLILFQHHYIFWFWFQTYQNRFKRQRANCTGFGLV